MDVYEGLGALGFTGQEGRVYVALLERPSVTGYELAKATGLSRSNVYHVLSALLERGAIQAVSDEPARYVAHPPASVLGRIKRETAERCDETASLLARIAVPSDPAAFWSLEGRESVIERIEALVGEARRRVAVCLWADDVEWMRPSLRAAHEAGCQLIVNVFGAADLDFGDVFRHEDPSKVVGGHLLTLVVDAQVALAADLGESSGAVYTRHLALVSLVEKLIRDEAYLAAIYDRFHDELEEAFGPSLVELRRRLLPIEQAERLVSIVSFGAESDTVAALLRGL